jgi:hypothetical protein
LWWDFFEIGSHELFCPGWLWTTILLISASWLARITGMSHFFIHLLFLAEDWRLLYYNVVTLKIRLFLSQGLLRIFNCWKL